MEGKHIGGNLYSITTNEECSFMTSPMSEPLIQHMKSSVFGLRS